MPVYEVEYTQSVCYVVEADSREELENALECFEPELIDFDDMEGPFIGTLPKSWAAEVKAVDINFGVVNGELVDVSDYLKHKQERDKELEVKLDEAGEKYGVRKEFFVDGFKDKTTIPLPFKKEG